MTAQAAVQEKRTKYPSVIGKLEDGTPLSIDLPRLIETRMVIEANSGGGKSYVIRKILEVTHGKVQQIVLDMEGEFSTLREKFDFILAGKEGDIPADPRSAELLARKVLELNASIIIDLSELKMHDRIKFVRIFLEALVEAPKELRHPVLVVVDEAHHFCPEKGKGEAESKEAVIDLATRGRKRGLCAIYATQRIAKFDKDAAAEGLNKLIGRTGLDIDQKRAGDELGFRTKEQFLSLRDLEPGEFYAFGPALSKQVVRVNIGEVVTTHPHSGERVVSVVPTPTEKVLKILSKLTDLPHEAEKELRSKEDMLAKIRELKQELRAKPRPELDVAAIKRIGQTNYAKGWKEAERQYKLIIQKEVAAAQILQGKLARISSVLGAKTEISRVDAKLQLPMMPKLEQPTIAEPRPAVQVRPEPVTTEYPAEGPPTKYGRCEKLILKFLSLQPDRFFTKPQIGAMTQYSPNGGGFNNSISLLRKQKLIVQKGETFAINSEELDRVRELTQDVELNSLADWLHTLGKAEREIFRVLKDEPSEVFTKESLGERTGYAPEGGGFNNAISHLCTLGLAEKTDDGVRFNSNLTEWLD
jgi:hypothetical protein